EAEPHADAVQLRRRRCGNQKRPGERDHAENATTDHVDLSFEWGRTPGAPAAGQPWRTPPGIVVGVIRHRNRKSACKSAWQNALRHTGSVACGAPAGAHSIPATRGQGRYVASIVLR